jgi:DNA polymerase III epsilon subunit-like protein
METLNLTNQNVRGTFNFWNKLFCEKKIISGEEKRSRKRMPVEEQAALYDALFDSDAFVPVKKALSEFTAFCILGRVSDAPILVAHNGRSFDHNIVRHHCHRLCLPQFPCEMYDSIPVARQIVPGLKSYSLGALHDRLVGTEFDHHHALADAHALHRICTALAKYEELPDVSCLWSASHGSLTSIKGVGAKTSKNLRGAGYSLPTLRETVLERETCPSPIKKTLRNHKSLWKKLRKKWTKEEQRAAKARVERRRRSKSV